MFAPRELPPALIESDDYQNLNDIQQKNFVARLHYCEEIADNITSWLNKSSDWKNERDFLDDLELDVSASHVLPSGQPEEFISSWLIHSSWTFDLEPDVLRRSLSNELLDALDRALPSFSSAPESVDEWLGTQSKLICSLIRGFSACAEYASAIAYLIALDIAMASLLASLYKLRLR